MSPAFGGFAAASEVVVAEPTNAAILQSKPDFRLGPQGGTARLDGGTFTTFGATATAGQSGSVVDVTLTSVGGFRFEPANLVIATGTSVRWTWLDDDHDIVSSGTPSFVGTGAFSPPKTHQVAFTTPGTYRYVCTIHAGMRGTVVVE